jgi:hypothetical protein
MRDIMARHLGAVPAEELMVTCSNAAPVAEFA